MARSPSYPGIDLAEAISRAESMYQYEKRNTAPVDTVLAHWGYKPGTGAGRIAVAAVKKFGLIEDHGAKEHRQIKLSDLALRIILDGREDSTERDAAIREAALLPTIHRELWEKYGPDLPSDASLSYFLRIEKKFTDSGAKELVDEYRATLAFAKLEKAGTIRGHEGATPGGSPPPPPLTPPPFAPPAPVDGDARSLRLPLPGGGTALIETTRPVTESEWAMVETVLSTMKASFIGDRPVEAKPDAGALADDDDFES